MKLLKPLKILKLIWNRYMFDYRMDEIKIKKKLLLEDLDKKLLKQKNRKLRTKMVIESNRQLALLNYEEYLARKKYGHVGR